MQNNFCFRNKKMMKRTLCVCIFLIKVICVYSLYSNSTHGAQNYTGSRFFSSRELGKNQHEDKFRLQEQYKAKVDGIIALPRKSKKNENPQALSAKTQQILKNKQEQVKQRITYEKERNAKKQLTKRRPLLYQYVMGRLGNVMFATAGLLAFSLTNEREVVVCLREPRYQSILKTFPNYPFKTIDISQMSQISEDLKTIEAKTLDYEYEMPADDVVIDPMARLFNIYPYWKPHTEEIRDALKFSDKITHLAYNNINNILAKHSGYNKVVPGSPEFVFSHLTATNSLTLVAVHVRRGDYARKNYTLPTMDYYRNAMDMYRQNYTNPVFIVFSSEIRWCSANFAGMPDVYMSKGKSPEVDMASISLCHHTVIGRGTFGWWGAFLAGGDNVYWTHPGLTGVDAKMRIGKASFLPHWTPLQD